MKGNTYRASRHVRLGVPDEHAYNMFLSVMAMCTRLGLWGDHISWIKSQQAFHRLTATLKGEHTKRKRNAQDLLSKSSSHDC